MPIDDQARLALVISLASSVVWFLLLIMILRSFKQHIERRPYILSMPLVGLIASVGTLASAIGFAEQIGVIDFALAPEVLTIIASMGRGALLMGGALALAYYTPGTRT